MCAEILEEKKSAVGCSGGVKNPKKPCCADCKDRLQVVNESDKFNHRCGLEHSLYYKEKEQQSNRAFNKLVLVALVSLVFCGTEAVGGVWSGSLAIMTDAAHQLSDVAGFVISFLAVYLTKKKSTLKYSYGYHRADVLGALASILIIWILLVWLLAEAIKRLLNQDLIEVKGEIMLVTACIGLGCNILNLITLNFCCNSKDESGNEHGLFDSVASAYKPFYGRFTHKKVRYDDQQSEDLECDTPKLPGDGQKEPLLGGDLESNAHSAKKSNGLNETGKEAGSAKNGRGESKHSRSQHGEVHDSGTESIEPMSPKARESRSFSQGEKVSHEKEAKTEDAGIIVEEVQQEELPDREEPNRKEQENINVRAAIVHMIGDMVQSLGVIIAALIIYFKPEWKIADPICTFLFSILVMITTIPVFNDCMRILMETSPSGEDIVVIFNSIQNLPYVCEIHDFHCWNLSDEKPILTAHIVTDENPNYVLYKITELLQREFEIYHTTIQIEPMKQTHLKAKVKGMTGLLKCINEHNFLDKKKILRYAPDSDHEHHE